MTMRRLSAALALIICLLAGSREVGAEADYYQGRTGSSTSGTCSTLGGVLSGTCLSALFSNGTTVNPPSQGGTGVNNGTNTLVWGSSLNFTGIAVSGGNSTTGGIINLLETAGSPSPAYKIGGDSLIVHPITSSPAEGGITDSNIGVGSGALAAMAAAGATTNAEYNTAIGGSALSLATSTDHITAVGYFACGSLTTSTLGGASSNNTCLGVDSMRQITSGSQNVAVGEHTGTFGSLATGGTVSNATYVGYGAGYYAGGTGNVAVGNSALKGIVGTPLSGNNNTTIGSSSFTLLQGANANNNVGVGVNTGALNTTGKFNTFIGGFAGSKVTTGTNNVFLGYLTGSTTLTTGSNNVVIGTSASCDTAANNSANTITICGGSTGIISVTGAGVPSTSATTIAGTLTSTGNVTATAQITAQNMTQSAAAQSGTVCNNTAGTLTYDATLGCLASDERLKTISPFTPAAPFKTACEEEAALVPIDYAWKPGTPKFDSDHGQHIGLGAFTTAYADERLIARDEKGNPRGWRQDAMIALGIACRQEQQKRLADLEKRAPR